MCGRFTQYRTALEYLDALRYDKPIEGGIDPEPINRYNVAPRSRVMIFYETDTGLRMARLLWGYQPFWAAGKRPPAINARVDGSDKSVLPRYLGHGPNAGCGRWLVRVGQGPIGPEEKAALLHPPQGRRTTLVCRIGTDGPHRYDRSRRGWLRDYHSGQRSGHGGHP